MKKCQFFHIDNNVTQNCYVLFLLSLMENKFLGTHLILSTVPTHIHVFFQEIEY